MSRRTTRSRAKANDADPAFLALPTSLQKKIDYAFDIAANNETHKQPPRKRRRIATPSTAVPEAGGFIVNDDPPAGGFIPEDAGGFIVEKDVTSSSFIPDDTEDASPVLQNSTTSAQELLPLEDAPDALAHLGLSADEDVLSVLKNAAGGWGGGSAAVQGINRRDWRAVCAVLLEGTKDERENGDEDVTPIEESGDEGDEYFESDLSELDDGAHKTDDEEYDARPTRFRKTRGVRAGYVSDSEGDDAPRALSGRQKREVLRAFALFFEDTADAELDEAKLAYRRLTVKDLSRASKLLKEGLSAEDVRIPSIHSLLPMYLMC
jgi:hypothetical protein